MAKHKSRHAGLLLLLILFLFGAARASALDVIHYDVTIEPDIAARTIKGKVLIRFVSEADEVEFDCGELVIDSARMNGAPLKFSITDRKLKIAIPKSGKQYDIEIEYHGAPRRGIRFFPDRNQVYTIFSTSQWMVCIDDPADKATIMMKVIVPVTLAVVTNGRFVAAYDQPNERYISAWRQPRAIPSYIFGFAVGPYRFVSEKHKGVDLRYAYTGYTAAEVRRIFRDTPDMFDFFKRRAGVKYPGSMYTQALAAGGVEQEMDSFTALKESYGKEVLENERNQWLGAHEFAHQWWGNMVTCRDWNHFWLNEGIATFMAAAYLEHRFGREVYEREIDSYRANYEKVRAAGKDKSLVFPDWLNPTREDRILVYDKGAYVMHLLREEIGERAFWNGLRLFTRRNFGKSVVTTDFKNAMEEAAGRSLNEFFAEWIYLKR